MRVRLVLGALVLSWTGHVHAADSLAAERIVRLEKSMQQLVDAGTRQGIVWAVARDGVILHSGAHGWRDRDAAQPIALDSVFRIYSMTRAVTAVALLQLVDQGKVRLTDPVGDYLPALQDLRQITRIDAEGVVTGPATEPVTLQQLLTYTAGFAYAPQYPASVGVDHRAILALHQTPAAAMQKLASYPLRDAPGARWRYGYHSDVLGILVETVSGQRLDNYLQEHIFAPLAMRDTGFVAREPERLVHAYDDAGNDITAQLPPSSDYLQPTVFHSGGGGLVSTAGDWVRFASMLINDGTLGDVRIISAASARAMRRNQLTPAQGPLFDYPEADFGQPGFAARFAGYGWGYSVGVRLADGAHSIPGQPGEISWGGLANTQWLPVPESGLVAVVFAQYFGARAPATDTALRTALFAEPPD
ncbi:MAG: serine hydrolase domain-containing protein [Gammaproteobacteria bacterium]|jgi:CubicO group peptidase (beta-lactamase class C family)|nr:serine hydrolase domain-containing protein [Gammaproteobacteria bacterium]